MTEPREGIDDEYAPLDLGVGLHVVSLLFFCGALASRHLVALLPAEYQRFPTGIFLTALGVPAMSGVGLLVGLVGLRRRDGGGLAKIAVFLNATALVLSGLAILAFFLILPD